MLDSDDKNIKLLRKQIFLAAYSGGIGHLASAYSIVEILYALYMKGILRFDAQNPLSSDRDRLIVSKGHGSLALYSVLSMAGFFPETELYTFCQPGSRLGGEPNVLEVPGVEASTGSLGHGLSIGIGMAIAGKVDKRNYHVYVILGDGECEEGSVWEGVMSAASFGLDNLTVIIDNNRLQKMGLLKDIMGINSWTSKWEAFGWQVAAADGHKPDDICQKLKSGWIDGKPRLLIAETVKGKGISIMENVPGWHWKMPNKKELKTVIRELNITDEELEKCKRHI